MVGRALQVGRIVSYWRHMKINGVRHAVHRILRHKTGEAMTPTDGHFDLRLCQLPLFIGVFRPVIAAGIAQQIAVFIKGITLVILEGAIGFLIDILFVGAIKSFL